MEMWCCAEYVEESYGMPAKQFVEPQKFLNPSGKSVIDLESWVCFVRDFDEHFL